MANSILEEKLRMRKRPSRLLSMAFIYAGNDLLSHTRVGRTLLSAKCRQLVVVWGWLLFFDPKGSNPECHDAGRSARATLKNHDVHPSLTRAICRVDCGQERRGRVSAPHGHHLDSSMPAIHKYEYRRRLPHYQKDRPLYVTFCKLNKEPLPEPARCAVLQHCLHDDGKKIQLHAAVVMPDHVHLLFTALRDAAGWPFSLPEILKGIKGSSARSVNKLTGHCGPVWQEESFDHVLRSNESLQQKLEYIRQNPVRRGLVQRPEDYQWLWVEEAKCGAGTPARVTAYSGA